MRHHRVSRLIHLRKMIRAVCTWPHALLAALVLAAWPVWRWYALRTIDGSDEPCGLLALGMLAVLVARNGVAPPREERAFALPGVALAIYLACFPWVPPLVRALPVLSALGWLLFRDRAGTAGCWGLLVLSLPIVATLQFYLGYPLRVLAAQASVAALSVGGLEVAREGTLLRWRGETILVDAPCSGVQMLWFGLCAACALAAFARLSAWRTALVLIASLALVIGANMARATALFFKEARLVSLPEWTHAGIGAVVFAGALWAIADLVGRLGRTRIQHREVRPCGA